MFPPTTLLNGEAERPRAITDNPPFVSRRRPLLVRVLDALHVTHVDESEPLRDRVGGVGHGLREDRKSTRLNSSH